MTQALSRRPCTDIVRNAIADEQNWSLRGRVVLRKRAALYIGKAFTCSSIIFNGNQVKHALKQYHEPGVQAIIIVTIDYKLEPRGLTHFSETHPINKLAASTSVQQKLTVQGGSVAVADRGYFANHF